MREIIVVSIAKDGDGLDVVFVVLGMCALGWGLRGRDGGGNMMGMDVAPMLVC